MKVCRFVVIIILMLSVSIITQLFAAEDSLSFATYYPAPYGYYNEMQVQKMAVGVVNTTSVPAENGQLFVDRSVIFNPQVDLNAVKNLSNPSKGEMVYSQGEDKFYYYNNGSVNNGWGLFSAGVNSVSHYDKLAADLVVTPATWTDNVFTYTTTLGDNTMVIARATVPANDAGYGTVVKLRVGSEARYAYSGRGVGAQVGTSSAEFMGIVPANTQIAVDYFSEQSPLVKDGKAAIPGGPVSVMDATSFSVLEIKGSN